MNNRRAFIVGLKSLILTKQEKSFLKKYRPWGIILFSRNIQTIKQTRKLTDLIKKIFKDKNYPILIDQEGGRVNRLKNIILFDNLTSEFYGNLYQRDKKKFHAYYQLFVDRTCHLLKNIGVNINTVPVLDLRYKDASSVIGDRSFSNDKKIVSRLGNVCINLFHKNLIGTIMKHIPGHGLAKVDSHNFTPVVDEL